MEEKLQDLYFFRIHNSYLINLNKVKEFNKSEDFVVLSNQVKLPAVSYTHLDVYKRQLSVVPIKLVGGLVPAFPETVQLFVLLLPIATQLVVGLSQ